MSNDRLDYQEATAVYDYGSASVELYFTSRKAFLRAVKRNPDYIAAADLNPGYMLTYRLADCRSIESLLRVAPGGDEHVHEYWLTDAEKTARAAAAVRIKKVRPPSVSSQGGA